MKTSFASKEFPFLGTDSGTDLAGPPAEYLSDLVDSPNVQSTAFSRRLETAQIPSTGFVCAAIRVAESLCPSDKDKITGYFESTFQCVLEKSPEKTESKGSTPRKSGAEKFDAARRGIWESLTKGNFVLAFWDYKEKEDAEKLLESLKKNLGTSLGKGVLMGRAWYPCQDFSIIQTFHNALKALDHAAFFHDNYLQDFNEVSLNISGDRKYQLAQYEKAMEEYQTGLAMEGRNINLLNSLGVCFGVNNELEKAKEQFRKALDLAPEDPMLLYNMGLVQHIQDQDENAIAYLKKAHGINAGIYEIELLLGKLFYKKNQYENAMPHLEKASMLKPGASSPLRLQGEIFLAQKKPVQAGQSFHQAVKLNANDAAALSGYAVAMADQGKNLQIAVTFARKSLSIEPENSLFSERLTRILHLQDQQPRSKLA